MHMKAHEHRLAQRREPKGRRHFHPIVLWLVPILGLLFVFGVLPIFISLYLSFFDYQILQPLKWVGVGNYVYALARDRVFHTTLFNTFCWTYLSVPFGMAISLLVAQSIHSRSHLKHFFRTVYFLPVVTPTVAVTMVWRFILQPSRFGLLNMLLGALGVKAQPWLTSADLVIPSLIVVGIWSGMGYNMVLFLAGLVGIPAEFYEAARIDGADSWRMFWKITWPLLSPTVLFVTVTGSIGALQVFTVPYIMTRGGPENASRMVVMWIQETGFAQYRLGYASTLAYILFFIIFLLTLVELRYLRTRWSF